MCHEYWLRRRERDAERESREVWLDFERTTPIADSEPADDRPEPARAEAREEALTADR